MGSPGPISEAEAQTYVHGICFKTGPPRRVGVELEWFVHDLGDPVLPVEPPRLAAALAPFMTAPPTTAPPDTGNGSRSSPSSAVPSGTPPVGPPGTPPDGLVDTPLHGGRLPAGALLSREPGGQVELSSLPAENLSECVDSVRRDLRSLREALGSQGLRLAGYGHDLWRPPRRTLDLPRYAAMEAFFDRDGGAGRLMMCGTASVQVCVDAGTEEPGPAGFSRRWRLAHLLGPVLVAAFANSPLLEGRPSGWRSTRQAVWTRLDASRTLAPPGLSAPAAGRTDARRSFAGAGPARRVRDAGAGAGRAAGGDVRGSGAVDPRMSWAAYALDAELMCVRRDGGHDWTVPGGTTFRQWINGARGCAERPPTTDDLDYHLTTLFPPVRPRGHLELRMIDAQAGEEGWIVPLAVVTALFEDAEASLVAETIMQSLAVPGPAAPRNPLWLRAARHGLADPMLAGAARACFAAVEAALPRLGAAPDIRRAVSAFTERYVRLGRCPADDLLDAVPARAATRSPEETPQC